MENSRINVSLLWSKSPPDSSKSSPKRSPTKLLRAISEQNLTSNSIDNNKKRPPSIGSPSLRPKLTQLEETENDCAKSPQSQKKSVVIPKLPLTARSTNECKSPSERDRDSDQPLYRIKSTSAVNNKPKSGVHFRIPKKTTAEELSHFQPITLEKEKKKKPTGRSSNDIVSHLPLKRTKIQTEKQRKKNEDIRPLSARQHYEVIKELNENLLLRTPLNPVQISPRPHSQMLSPSLSDT